MAFQWRLFQGPSTMTCKQGGIRRMCSRMDARTRRRWVPAAEQHQEWPVGAGASRTAAELARQGAVMLGQCSWVPLSAPTHCQGGANDWCRRLADARDELEVARDPQQAVHSRDAGLLEDGGGLAGGKLPNEVEHAVVQNGCRRNGAGTQVKEAIAKGFNLSGGGGRASNLGNDAAH